MQWAFILSTCSLRQIFQNLVLPSPSLPCAIISAKQGGQMIVISRNDSCYKNLFYRHFHTVKHVRHM